MDDDMLMAMVVDTTFRGESGDEPTRTSYYKRACPSSPQ
jgi:hypothetical protein